MNDAFRPPPFLGARIELLRRAGRAIESSVSGRSMEPAIPSGAEIRIAPDSAVPRVGTTVAIVTPNGLVAHRLIAHGTFPWNRGFVLTQGDGSRLCDPPVPVHLVLGAVAAWRLDGEWRAVPPIHRTARATGHGAALWRRLVGLGFAVHPWLAGVLVRCSLRGRVPEARWSA